MGLADGIQFGLFCLAYITILITIYVLVVDNQKITHSYRLATFLYFLLATLTEVYIYYVLKLGIEFLLSILAISLVFPGSIITTYILGNKRGVKFGEKFILLLHTYETQVHLFVDMFQNNEDGNLEEMVRDAIINVLNDMAIMLKLIPEKDESHISVFLPTSGRFIIIANIGINSARRHIIESDFTCGNNYNCTAGYVVNFRTSAYIKDLSDANLQAPFRYRRVYQDDKDVGSLYSFPIFRGTGENEIKDIMAVINITSKRKNAFNNPEVFRSLEYFGAQIETLLYLLEMINSNKRHQVL
jgi:hypothetical protein